MERDKIINGDVVIAQCEEMINELKDMMSYNECLSYIRDFEDVRDRYNKNFFNCGAYIDDMMELYEELLSLNITVDGKRVGNRREAITYKYYR